MLLTRWIDSLLGHQRMVEDLVYRIAARCEPAVWARISATAFSMDPAQARGYIRARSTLIVNREVSIATSAVSEVTPSMIERIKHGVADELVRVLAGRIAKQHPAKLRRAA